MARTWSEIKRHYLQLGLQGMVRLIEQIEASSYVTGVWAWTSMYDLCVAQMPVTDPLNVGSYLRISPLFNGNVEFRYLDTYAKDRQWHRVVAEREAFSRLERFFDQLNWFGRRPEREQSEARCAAAQREFWVRLARLINDALRASRDNETRFLWVDDILPPTTAPDSGPASAITTAFVSEDGGRSFIEYRASLSFSEPATAAYRNHEWSRILPKPDAAGWLTIGRAEKELKLSIGCE
jgi:hypothetical protein